MMEGLILGVCVLIFIGIVALVADSSEAKDRIDILKDVVINTVASRINVMEHKVKDTLEDKLDSKINKKTYLKNRQSVDDGLNSNAQRINELEKGLVELVRQIKQKK